jgi:hypothetical protein
MCATIQVESFGMGREYDPTEVDLDVVVRLIWGIATLIERVPNQLVYLDVIMLAPVPFHQS